MMLVPSIFKDNFIDDFFNDNLFSFPNGKSVSGIPMMMHTDVKETENEFELGIELPGYNKENIQAELKDGYLTINAEKTENKDEKEDGKYIRKERYTGHCSRTFYVGEDIAEDDIKAKFENGVLTLNIPKEVKKPEVEQKKLIAITG